MKKWFDENKVLVFGALSAGLMAMQQFLLQPTINWLAVGYAVGVGIIGFMAKNWRGQSGSLVGIIGNTAIAFTTVYETGNFTLAQFIAQLIFVLGFAFMPDPKSRGYEQTDTIRNAKIDGEIIQPAALTNTEIKKEAKAIEASPMYKISSDFRNDK